MEYTEAILHVDPYGYADFSGAIYHRLMEHFTIHQIYELRSLTFEHRSNPILIKAVHEIGLKESGSEDTIWKIVKVPTVVAEFADIEFIDQRLFGGASDERLVYHDLTPIVLKVLADPSLTSDQIRAILQHCVDHYYS